MVPEARLDRDVFVASTSDVLPRDTMFLPSGRRPTVLPEKAVYLDCQHRVVLVLGVRPCGKWRGDD